MKSKLIASTIAFLIAVPALAEDKGEFGNHCAFGLTRGNMMDTPCTITTTDAQSGKTYCFSTENAKKEWLKDPAGNPIKATESYAKLGANHGEKGHSKVAHEHDDHEHEMRKITDSAD